MQKYYVNENLSTNDCIVVEDNNGNMYEYQTDTRKVFVINRHIDDNGEELNNDTANEIRTFFNISAD